MRLLSISVCVTLFSAAAFAQLDSGTITITASRPVTLQPDQVSFSVSVYAAPNTSFDDILAGLAGTGITAANFSSASSASDSLVWQFALTVPFSKMQSTVAALTAAQQKTGPKSAIQQVTYNVQTAGISPETIAAQTCIYTSLLSDAQSQARKVANTAGQKVGEILSMTDHSGVASIAIVNEWVSVPTAVTRIGDFSSLLLGSPAFQSATAFPTCALTVQFRLLP